MRLDDPMDTPAEPMPPTASPEVGLAELVVEAWIYREMKALHCGGDINPPLPDRWPFIEAPHPDWRTTYRQDMEKSEFLSKLIRDGAEKVYRAASLTKHEQDVFEARSAGATWGLVAQTCECDAGNARKSWRRVIEKLSKLSTYPNHFTPGDRA